MKLMKWLALSALMGFFAACGGGGNSGTSSFGTGSGTGTGGTGTGTTASAASLVLSISSTTSSSATPATVTATLRSSSGAALPGYVVSFSSVGGLGAFNVGTVLTDANGQATVKVTPATSSSNGADLVLGKATVGTMETTGTIGFQVSPSTGTIVTGAPSIALALSTSTVATATPATVTATVRDAAGVLLAGQVVKFSTAGSGFGGFSVVSALTNASGVATTMLTPASSSSNGADLVIAQATVAGVLVTNSVGFSVSSPGASPNALPSLALSISTQTVTTATPATVIATIKDATGVGIAGQVVKFSTVDGLGSLSVSSALTDSSGVASTTLTATTATQSGADQVVATATVNGTSLQRSQGFRLTAASVAIASIVTSPAVATLSAYGQANVVINLSGTVAGTPATVSLTSACIATGKATLTPSTATTTTAVATFTYKDNGCGATSSSDTLQASITGSAATGSLQIAIASPTVNSITFVSASPTSIFLKGSGFTESSTVTFRVLDTAGNGVPGRTVTLQATTFAGGLTINGCNPTITGCPASLTAVSDSNGIVTALVNSGTVPTPVRVSAATQGPGSTTISTVSSTLAIAVGLPSQLNFSLAQGTINIEGLDRDGTPNTYTVIASDRLGNPVAAGTAINFITEGGQVEQIKNTTISANGIASATANYVSASPKPADGRITVVAYALGEESFLDQNGNNVWDAGEPFQDLGSLYVDRYFNGHYNKTTDQFIPLLLPGATTATCAPITNSLLAFDVTIPSVPSVDPAYPGFVAPPTPTSCDGTWGRAYVRRAVQTILSSSTARPVWNSSPSNAVVGACVNLILDSTTAAGAAGYNADETINRQFYPLVGGTALYNATGAYSFLVADANGTQLNPVAAGSTITISATTGVTALLLGGSPVASTSRAPPASFSVGFQAPTVAGTVTISITSPSGVTTSVPVQVYQGSGSPSSPC